MRIRDGCYDYGAVFDQHSVLFLLALAYGAYLGHGGGVVFQEDFAQD